MDLYYRLKNDHMLHRIHSDSNEHEDITPNIEAVFEKIKAESSRPLKGAILAVVHGGLPEPERKPDENTTKE